MKRIVSLGLLVMMLLGLCGCADTAEYEWTGAELFGLPEQASSYTLRHAGESRLYLNFERGDRCAAYQSALRELKLNKSVKKGSLDANTYEIVTEYYVFDDVDGRVGSNSIEAMNVKLIVNGNMVLYNDQWYEADTSRLLRQLERDFAG